MARFQSTVNVWALGPEERAELQPGQWITAGGALGRWVGQTRNSDVAMWLGGVPKGGHHRKFRQLRDYAEAFA